jgi:hypothetical protein
MFKSLAIQNPSGTVTYSGGTESADISVTLAFQVRVTQACATAIASGTTVTLSASVCSGLQQSFATQSGVSSATCTYASGECQCQVNENKTSVTSASYTVSGTNIVYTDGDAPVGYCVSGDTLTEHGTFSGVSGITGIAILHR